ncbi:MAG: TIM barrel protein [Spirochaetota bacterium]
MYPVICLEMLFPELDLPEKVERIASEGFQAVEFWGWRDKDLFVLKAACDHHGVRIANFSGHRRGSLIAPETYDLFFTDLNDAVGTARNLGCSILMLLSNELGEGGRVVNSYPDIPPDGKYRNLRQGLEQALEVTPEDIHLVLEPLNTRLDHPGYYLENMATAVSLIREVDHPRLKVLCDLYHLGMMGENLEKIIAEQIEYIGYFHAADFPGRHEPGSGSADWPSLLRQIAQSGYEGMVGFEYSPESDSVKSLRRIWNIWEESVG